MRKQVRFLLAYWLDEKPNSHDCIHRRMSSNDYVKVFVTAHSLFYPIILVLCSLLCLYQIVCAIRPHWSCPHRQIRFNARKIEQQGNLPKTIKKPYISVVWLSEAIWKHCSYLLKNFLKNLVVIWLFVQFYVKIWLSRKVKDLFRVITRFELISL